MPGQKRSSGNSQPDVPAGPPPNGTRGPNKKLLPFHWDEIRDDDPAAEFKRAGYYPLAVEPHRDLPVPCAGTFWMQPEIYLSITGPEDTGFLKEQYEYYPERFIPAEAIDAQA
jgi:hypothetical protein